MHTSKREFSLEIYLIAAIFLSGVMPAAILAQSTFGSVLGTVRDTSGSIIPNAAVKLTNIDENTSRTLQANSNGDYEAVNTK
ncbi:MAG: carboxypeptidase-like regulatory domain-containing protein, partial [Acidobacteriota bacterium]